MHIYHHYPHDKQTIKQRRESIQLPALEDPRMGKEVKPQKRPAPKESIDPTSIQQQ